AAQPAPLHPRQARTAPFSGAEPTPPINALQTANILAAGADLAEQAGPSGWLVRAWGSVGVGEGVDDVLWAQVGCGRRCRVVAVTGRRGTGLEVLHERLAVLVEEGLADEPASHRCLGVRPAEQGSVSAALQAWQLGHRCNGQGVGEAERDGEEE